MDYIYYFPYTFAGLFGIGALVWLYLSLRDEKKKRARHH